MTSASPDNPSTDLDAMNINVSFSGAFRQRFEENALACGFESPEDALRFALTRFNNDIEALRNGKFPSHADPLTEHIDIIRCPEYAKAANLTSFDTILKLDNVTETPKPKPTHLRLVPSSE